MGSRAFLAILGWSGTRLAQADFELSRITALQLIAL
jgi:hypothetical protein